MYNITSSQESAILRCIKYPNVEEALTHIKPKFLSVVNSLNLVTFQLFWPILMKTH